MSSDLERASPNLAANGDTVTSLKTHAYNCIAWAAGDASRWWEPGIDWTGPGDHETPNVTRLRRIGAKGLWRVNGTDF